MTIKPIIKKLKKDYWNNDDIKAILIKLINKIDNSISEWNYEMWDTTDILTYFRDFLNIEINQIIKELKNGK